MEKNIIAFLSVFFLSTTLCAQVNLQVEQFKPTFYKSDNSSLRNAQREAIEADNARSDNYQRLLMSVTQKVINYMQGETDEVFFEELKKAANKLAQFGTYISPFDAETIRGISKSVDISYINYLERKKYPQTTTPTEAEQATVDSTSTMSISSENKFEQDSVPSDSTLNNTL